MKNGNKNKFDTKGKNKNKHVLNSHESVLNELYYSHLLELLFDQGSGGSKKAQKKQNITKLVNKITKTKGSLK